jgi:hypothetical protein
MATMTLSRWISLVAAVLTAAGAVVLYQWGGVGESIGGWQTRANLEASIQAQSARSLYRQKMQRIGLGLVVAGAVLTVVAQLLP